jgi:hypothetical protein
MRKGILYHVGFLMCDREGNCVADSAGNKMWRRYEKGEVHLVQRKRELGVWEYWAVPNTGGCHVERVRNSNNASNRSSVV